MDLALYEGRLVLVWATACGKKMKLMTITASTMAGTGVARVDPDGNAVGRPRPGDISGWRLFLAAHFYLQRQSPLVPGHAHIGERAPFIHVGEAVQPTRFGQIEQVLVVFAWQLGNVVAGVANTEEKAVGDQRHCCVLPSNSTQ